MLDIAADTTLRTETVTLLLSEGLLLSGVVTIRAGRRLTDMINTTSGFVHLLTPRFDPSDSSPSVEDRELFVRKASVSLILPSGPSQATGDPEERIVKRPLGIVAHGSAFSLRGNAHIAPGSDAATWFERQRSPFLPLTDLELVVHRPPAPQLGRSYPFGLLRPEHADFVAFSDSPFEPSATPG